MPDKTRKSVRLSEKNISHLILSLYRQSDADTINFLHVNRVTSNHWSAAYMEKDYVYTETFSDNDPRRDELALEATHSHQFPRMF